MRVGRLADDDGAAFWGLIDSAGETVRRIGGDPTQWAPSAAAEVDGIGVLQNTGQRHAS